MRNTIFFDLDDTLYDRSLPFMKAYSDFFGNKDSTLAYKAFLTCNIRGNEVFLLSQRGEMTMEEMYIYRYVKGFADVSIEINSEEALRFQELYGKRQKEIEGDKALYKLLKYCRKRYRSVGIISNGPAEHQWDKIKKLGIDKYVVQNNILISGEVGIDKPDSAIFDMALSRCGATAGEAIYVGDSYENDILPAKELGFEVIWIDKKQQRQHFDCSGIQVVDCLEDVMNII